MSTANPAQKELDDKLKEPTVFGEVGDYWAKHDRITDRFDKDMMARLNIEADNILIFVCFLN